MEFFKYQGAGNDFIMVDDRSGHFNLTQNQIARICDRRFGIGADGLILLQKDAGADFRMVYYNADGGESTMCGNGGRCIVAFAQQLGLIQTKTVFVAADGLHEATIEEDLVNLKMTDVAEISTDGTVYFLNTGSPHHVEFREGLEGINVAEEGARIRHAPQYSPGGSNVNFAEKMPEDVLKLRTYERGVEAETLACGTGATAAALVLMAQTHRHAVRVEVLGGTLWVSAEPAGKGFKNIWLKGPAQFVFKGEIPVDLPRK